MSGMDMAMALALAGGALGSLIDRVLRCCAWHCSGTGGKGQRLTSVSATGF